MNYKYLNKTAKVQVMNLRSGKSLFADPHKWHILDEGDEHSEEILSKVGEKGLGFLLPIQEEPKPAKEEPPKNGLKVLAAGTMEGAK